MGGLVGGIFSAVGDAVNNIYGRWANERDFGYQKDLNNNQISWRVADAQRAGIHPIYALGPTGATFSPVSTNFAQSSGQDLSRAEAANKDRAQRERERISQYQNATAEEQRAAERHKAEINRLNTETALIQSQIARENSAQLGPGGPRSYPNARPGSVQRVPARNVVGSPGNPAREPGAITDYSYYRSSDGGIRIIPSEQMKERIEDSPLELDWIYRNQLQPMFGGVRPPSNAEFPLPDGYVWRWSAWRQGFFPARRRRSTGGGGW